MHLLSYPKALLLSVLFSITSFSSTFSMELIASGSVSSPEPVKLFSNHKDLFIEDEVAVYRVDRHNMSPLLQEVMKRSAMGKFTEQGDGYIRIKQLSDHKYALDAHVRGFGGGPITGVCAYWGTKAAGWGAFAVAVWATHGEMILHTVEYAHMIEAASTTAGLAGTALPTP